ncbi:unnamed protein product [Linum tenue]|uniref:Gag1-like clamp domain-containing protein n=1 Tax=Linum tenue TaxID=586396 RepID=A0AAV0JZZ7_9ROSI|nr:unnamed protein product [Linum tenue]
MFSTCCVLNQTERCVGRKPCSSFVLLSGAYFRVVARMGMEGFRSKWKGIFSSRGCFGCCAKPTTVVSVNEHSKSLRPQERIAKKYSITDDFWSSSAAEMDNSAIQSQRSMSSISTLNQPLDPCTKYIENGLFLLAAGLLLWNQTRQQWLANKLSQSKTKPQAREPTISWNASYDSLLGSNKPFHHPVPLAEMVDFLVDVWEQEGLYD